MPTDTFGKWEGPGVSGLGGENRLPGPLCVGAPSEAVWGGPVGGRRLRQVRASRPEKRTRLQEELIEPAKLWHQFL